MAKHKINRRQTGYQLLNAAFPLAFPLDDAAIQPLAVSSRNDLTAWAECQGLDAPATLRLIRTLQNHCSRRTYQATVVAGALRVNLHGEPVKPVTPEGEAHAQQRIAAILAKRIARAPQTKTSRVKPPKPVVAELVKAAPTVIVKKRRVVAPRACPP